MFLMDYKIEQLSKMVIKGPFVQKIFSNQVDSF